MNFLHRMGLRVLIAAVCISLLYTQSAFAQDEGPVPPQAPTWDQAPPADPSAPAETSQTDAESVTFDINYNTDIVEPVRDYSAGGFHLFLPQLTLGGAAPSGTGLTRAQATQLYQAYYVPGINANPNWNGNVNSCQPGATSSAFHAAVEARINYFRQMAGLPTIRLNDQYTAKAQSAALMMSANKTIDHSPDGNWNCYSSEGAEAAGSSNLFLSVYGPAAIDGYIRDPGTGNVAAGHRRWILYPSTKVMGSGDIPAGSTPAANALWVFDDSMWSARPATATPYVAWPPAGYVPYNTVFPRWSFALPNADFANASVTLTLNGSNVPVTRYAPVNGYGENTLVWQINGMSDWQAFNRPSRDTTYQVRIDNVRVDGTTKSYSYSVTLFAAD